MSDKSAIITLDVRGEICPAPLIKAMDAMKTASQGQQIEMVTDFHPAILVVTNAALKQGWDVNIRIIDSGSWKVILTRMGQAVLPG